MMLSWGEQRTRQRWLLARMMALGCRCFPSTHMVPFWLLPHSPLSTLTNSRQLLATIGVQPCMSISRTCFLMRACLPGDMRHTRHTIWAFPRAHWVNTFLDVSHALSLFWFPHATGGINSAPESYFPTLPSLSGLMEDAAEGFSSLFVRAPESRRSSEDLENEPTGCAQETGSASWIVWQCIELCIATADLARTWPLICGYDFCSTKKGLYNRSWLSKTHRFACLHCKGCRPVSANPCAAQERHQW